MTPEEHYICAMSALEMPDTEQREFVAEFRRSLIEHDTRVIEDFLYGSEGDSPTHVPSIVAGSSHSGPPPVPPFAPKFLGPMGPEENETMEIPAFADTSTCSRCEEEHPADELEDEWCEACLRVGGSV